MRETMSRSATHARPLLFESDCQLRDGRESARESMATRGAGGSSLPLFSAPDTDETARYSQALPPLAVSPAR